jgi:hypothetical protein
METELLGDLLAGVTFDDLPEDVPLTTGHVPVLHRCAQASFQRSVAVAEDDEVALGIARACESSDVGPAWALTDGLPQTVASFLRPVFE